MNDTAEIKIQAGKGGDGIVSFRREKYIPKGGPWGGDGGKGGDIILQVDDHLNTLTPFRRQTIYKAPNGKPGMRNRKSGRNGENLVLKVPRGTVVYQENAKIADLTKNGEQFTIAGGGKGGLGNWHFKSSINQTPKQATAGEPGEEKIINLELQLIADVGIIGLPSSGKSTLLNTLTNANVKTAGYHFTTLEPNLGVLKGPAHVNLVLADIPGLIEGASTGKGLGHGFLRHIERTNVLIHLLDGADILTSYAGKLLKNYETIREELKNWDLSLLTKPEVIAVNKSDLIPDPQVRSKIQEVFKKKVHFISAVTREGLPEFILEVAKRKDEHAESARNGEMAEMAKLKTVEYDINSLPNKRIVFRRTSN